MSQRKLKKIRQEIKKVEENIVEYEQSFSLRTKIKEIWKSNWLYLIGITLLVIVIYFNGMWGGFVSDDYASITANPYINDFWKMFSYGNSMSFSTYLVSKLFGITSSVPYHILNLIIFILVCITLFVLMEIIFDNVWLTRLSVLLFAVHPIHVEAVSWISGRVYLLVSWYVLLSLICIIGYTRTRKNKYLWLAFFTFFLAFSTDRPRPFSLILLIMVYVLTMGIKNIRINWKKTSIVGLVLMSLFLIIAWQNIIYRINVVNSGYNASESVFYNPFFQYPTGISKYLQLLYFPIDLTLYHTMYIFPVWLNWMILLTYLTAIVYFYFKNKRYFFALSFILAAILPSIAPVKVSWLVAERYMFLGSFGFCMFMALLIIDISRKYKLLMPIITGLIVVFFGVRTVFRNVDWQTNHNLWVNTCQVSPNSHNAWNNIGDDYDKLATAAKTDIEKKYQFDNAIKGFTQSTVIKPNYADAYHNRANIFFKIGRLDLARDSYNTALYYSPSLYQTYLSLTQIDLMESNLQLAYEHASKALQLDPTNPQAAYVLAIVYAQAGNKEQAITILKEILKQTPSFTMAKQALLQLEPQ